MEQLDDYSMNPVVLDFGTSTVKAGFAGDVTPTAVFPCVVGKPNSLPSLPQWHRRDFCVGDAAVSDMKMLTLNWPVDRGIVINWDDMVKFYHHTFYNELKIGPEQYPVLLTEPVLKYDANNHEKKVHRENREKMCNVMFEIFNVPGIYVSPQPFLSLISSGSESGLVLDLGTNIGQCVPTHETQVIRPAAHEFGMAGRDLTDNMNWILSRKGFSFTTQAERKIVEDIKEKLCYVAIDYEKELKTSKSSSSMTKNYELPDGQVIDIGPERFKCPEALFQPLMVGSDFGGIHQVVYNSIMMCHEDIRKELFNNIILSGGCSTFLGFSERVKKELSLLVKDNTSVNVNVKKHPDPMLSVWLGGSILASLASFQQMWITKSEYEETGQSIVHDRCY